MSHSKSAIVLSEKDLAGRLPRVCLCCGAPATVVQPKGFWLQAPIQSVRSTGVIGVTRMLMQVSDAASKGEHLLRAPFCEKHANYWSGRTRILMARFGLVAIFVGGLVVAAVLALRVGTGAALGWAAFCVLALFVGAGFMIRAEFGRIEQMEPNPRFLILSNVSEEFHEAMDRLRREDHAKRTNPYSVAELADLQRRQRRRQIVGNLVLPSFAALAVLFVGGVLALIAPPSGLPKPAGGERTRGNDLHCYELLMSGIVSREARSWLRGRPQETVEGWDHATTVSHVDQLYALGAQRVYYHPVLLVVVLPKDPDSRARIFQYAAGLRKDPEKTPDEQQWYLMVTAN